MSTPQHPSDKRGKSILIGGSLGIWLAILLLFNSYGYTRTWELWRVPVESPPFSDFRLIPGSAETLRMGIEPSERNPGDPHKRKFNYPTFWRLFFYTGISEDDTIWISALMIGLFFGAVFLFPQNLTPAGAMLLLLIAFSPAAMLLYERGNVDLIVFVLCVLIVMAAGYSAYAAAALLMFAAIVKLFPFFGATVLLRESKSRFAWLLAACALILLVYVFITWDSVRASWDLTMRGRDISYGASVIFQRYDRLSGNSPHSLENVLGTVPLIVALTVVLIATAAGLRNELPLTADSGRNLAAFRMGASIYVGTFLLGNNWDYRLAFLILAAPQLLEWAGKLGSGRPRFIPSLVLLALVASCWHFMVWYAPSLAGIREMLFVLDELFNWILLGGLSYLLGRSAPGWLGEGLRRREREFVSETNV